MGAAAASAALKQLRLSKCQLYDDDAAFLAAMAQLPAGLEHPMLAALLQYGTVIVGQCLSQCFQPQWCSSCSSSPTSSLLAFSCRALPGITLPCRPCSP